MDDEAATASTVENNDVGIILGVYCGEHVADDIQGVLTVCDIDYLVGDTVVVRKDAKGKVHIAEAVDVSTSEGIGIGAMFGGFLGLLAGPVGLVSGLLGGSVLGGLAAYKDIGFDQQSLERIGGALIAGSSAVIILLAKDQASLHRAEKERDPIAQRITARSLSDTIRENLSAEKDVVFSFIMSGGVLAAGEVTVSDNMVTALGLVNDQVGLAVGEIVNNDRV